MDLFYKYSLLSSTLAHKPLTFTRFFLMIPDDIRVILSTYQCAALVDLLYEQFNTK